MSHNLIVASGRVGYSNRFESPESGDSMKISGKIEITHHRYPIDNNNRSTYHWIGENLLPKWSLCRGGRRCLVYGRNICVRRRRGCGAIQWDLKGSRFRYFVVVVLRID